MNERNRHDGHDDRGAHEREASRTGGGEDRENHEDRDTLNDAEREVERAAERDGNRALTPRERKERWPLG